MAEVAWLPRGPRSEWPRLGSRALIIRLIIQTIRRDPAGADQIDEASNVSRPDRSGADQIDAEHQATDLAVGVRIPRGEHHRVQGCSSSPAGARLTPGTGRRPRLRGQRRQRRAGNVGWTTRGGARPEQASLAPEQRCDRWRSGVVTWAHSTAAAELHGDYCGSAGRAGGHLPPGRRAPPPGERLGRGRALLL